MEAGRAEGPSLGDDPSQLTGLLDQVVVMANGARLTQWRYLPLRTLAYSQTSGLWRGFSPADSHKTTCTLSAPVCQPPITPS